MHDGYKLKIELHHKIGDEFEYDDKIGLYPLSKYVIRAIIISILPNSEIKVKYATDEYIDNERFKHSLKKFSESEIDRIIGIKPYIFEKQCKFNFDDIVIGQVNSFHPSDIETIKDSGIHCPTIRRIDNIIITINKDNPDGVVMYDSLLKPYDNGRFGVECTLGWPRLETMIGLVSDLDVDRLLEIKCEEFSKKCYRDNPHDALYVDGKAVISPFGYYENKFAGLFKYLGVEDKAIEMYYNFVNARLENTLNINKKSHSLSIDEFISTLTEDQKDELLQKLLNRV